MNREAKIYNCVVYDCRTPEEREAYDAGYQKGREEGIDRAKKAETELAIIDSLLARREALDSFPTRFAKIQHAIIVAAESERLKENY